jgi:8-oxo-dGTP pyrophosphatase MutT (NUDIX family)
MIKHFTATAFVIRGNATLLLWHRRLQQWMPPGGHIEENEDPVEAVLREVLEETGLVCRIAQQAPDHAFSYPQQIAPPHTILVEDIPGPDKPHKHIDLIYFVTPVDGAAHGTVDDPTLRWVTAGELRENSPLDVAGCGVSAAIPDDVRELALAAIREVKGAP